MGYKLDLIKKTLKEKRITFSLIFIGYILLNMIVNKTFHTLPVLFKTFKLGFATIYFLTNIVIIPFLVALTIVLAIDKIKDLTTASKAKGGVSVLAIFGTLLGGACPGCFVGLFPAVVGIFGTTLTLGSLPLQGLEIQFISGLILVISINYLTKPTVCKIK